MVVDRVNLTSVAVVCQYVEAMSGADGLVSGFLDASVLWTMRSAVERCSCGTVRLLGRIAAREDPQMDPLLKSLNFTQCLDKAIEKGNFEVVKWVVEIYLPNGRIRKPVYTAVKHSRLEILQWLRANHDERVVWEPSMLIQADSRAFSDLETLKWLHENVVEVDDTMKRILMGNAVRFQLVDRVAWLYSLDYSPNHPVVMPELSSAVDTGNIAMVEWICDNTGVHLHNKYLEHAMRCGHIALAQWLFNNHGFSLVSAGAVVAVIRKCSSNTNPGDSHVIHELLDWALELLTISHMHQLAILIDDFAKFGDLEGVKKIHQVSGLGMCSTNAMDMAVSLGRFDMVEWFHENRFEGCSTKAMDSAATNGRLDLLEWFHEHRSEGCTSAAMDYAAKNGHLDVVQWLSEHRTEGCTKDAMHCAAENGHIETLRWLHEHRREGCYDSTMDRAAENGHHAVVTWLHEHWSGGCTTNAMDGAARNGHLDVVKFLHNSRSEGCTSRAMTDAASNGHLETVKWLYFNRTEGNLDIVLHYATQSRQFEVMQWLYRCKIRDQSYAQSSAASKFKYLDEAVIWTDGLETADVAESVMKIAVKKGTKAEIGWLLQRLPNCWFSSASVLAAIGSNRLDIAMLLVKDGRFICDFDSIHHDLFYLRNVEVPVFQWLVRDFSNSTPETRWFSECAAISKLFIRDALDELEHLAAITKIKSS